MNTSVVCDGTAQSACIGTTPYSTLNISGVAGLIFKFNCSTNYNTAVDTGLTNQIYINGVQVATINFQRRSPTSSYYELFSVQNGVGAPVYYGKFRSNLTKIYFPEDNQT